MFRVLAKSDKLKTALTLLSFFVFISCADKGIGPLKPVTYKTKLTHADDDEGIFKNAVQYYSQQDYSSAISEIKRLDLNSLNPDFRLKVMWLLGNLQFETGDRSRSVSTLLKVMETATEEETRSKPWCLYSPI
jgi:hypothetical protein